MLLRDISMWKVDEGMSEEDNSFSVCHLNGVRCGIFKYFL